MITKKNILKLLELQLDATNCIKEIRRLKSEGQGVPKFIRDSLNITINSISGLLNNAKN